MIKEASIKEFGKALIRTDAHLIIPGSVLMGSSIGQVYSQQHNKELLKNLLEDIGTKQTVDAKSFTKKLAPEINVITSRDDIKKSNFNFIEKFQLRSLINKEGKISGGAFYVPNKKGNDVIISPKKINKHALGHEIGHHIDMTANKPRMFEIDPVFGKRVQREEAAWAASPIKQKSESSNKLMVDALKTYEDVRKFGRRGAVIGAGSGVLASILFALKKTGKL